MPVVVPSGPYPTFATVMNLARAYVNDTLPGATGTSGEGQIFTNSGAMTIPFLRAMVAELYQELGNTGAGVVLRDNYILESIPPMHGANGLGAADSAVQVHVDYEGYFDGTTVNGDVYLPPDLIVPLKVYERVSGSNDDFSEMTEAQNGLPAQQQTTAQSIWSWEFDRLVMPGSLVAEDLRLRYVCALPLLAGTPDLTAVSVPIADCENALALKLARSYGFARGSDQIPAADAMQKQAVRILQNRYIRAQQAVDFRAQPYGQASNLWPLDSFRA